MFMLMWERLPFIIFAGLHHNDGSSVKDKGNKKGPIGLQRQCEVQSTRQITPGNSMYIIILLGKKPYKSKLSNID